MKKLLLVEKIPSLTVLYMPWHCCSELTLYSMTYTLLLRYSFVFTLSRVLCGSLALYPQLATARKVQLHKAGVYSVISLEQSYALALSSSQSSFSQCCITKN